MSKILIVTVKDEMKEKIEKQAEKSNISQSAVVNVILAEHFNKET